MTLKLAKPDSINFLTRILKITAEIYIIFEAAIYVICTVYDHEGDPQSMARSSLLRSRARWEHAVPFNESIKTREGKERRKILSTLQTPSFMNASSNCRRFRQSWEVPLCANRSCLSLTLQASSQCEHGSGARS